MSSVLLSLTIVIVLACMGDWLRRWLVPGASGAGWVERLVLSAWCGFIVLILAMNNWVHLVGRWPIKYGAWPIVAALTALSIAAAVRQRGRPRDVQTGTAWMLLIVPTIGLILISTPFFGQDSTSFYYANNGEYMNYADIADVVKHHAGGEIVRSAMASRESVAAAGCAFFATLFRAPTIFVVQPFANAIGWLSFACLGLLFHGICRDFQAGPFARGGALLLYSLAICSAANQQLWTLSVLSQYVNTAVFFGLLAFLLLERRAALTAPGSRRAVVAIGLSVGVMACGYPDMLLPTLGLVGLFELFGTSGRPAEVWRLAVRFATSLAVAAVVANRLASELVPVLAASRFSQVAGWDFYGHTDVRILVGNLIGLSSLFYDPKRIGWLLTNVVVITIGIALVRLAMAWRQHVVARQVLGVTLCYLIGVTVLFVVVIAGHRYTNYMAVKFTIAFIWLMYLAAAAALVSGPRLDVLKCLLILGWAAVAIPIGSEAVLFSARIAEEAKSARFSRDEAAMIRSSVGPARRVAVLGSPWNFAAIGSFLVHDEDLLASGQLLLKGNIGQWTRPDVGELNGQRYALTLGTVRDQVPAVLLAEFRPILERASFSLWQRESRGQRALKGVSATSTYASDAYSVASAFDRDERTAWAANGPKPASVDITPRSEGVLEGIVLEGRGDPATFLETWRQVRVRLFSAGRVVADQTFTLPDASRTLNQQVTLPPVTCDRILLDFDIPVTTTVTGQAIAVEAVNPGYREIILRWKE